MQTLSDEFKKTYRIASVGKQFTTGQKIVYIVTDEDGVEMALKAFRNCNQRDIQEIEILQRFNELPGISKIVKTEEYEGNPILFEAFIDAPDLDEIMQSYAGDAERIAHLMNSIALILKPIWEEKIVHRDLKPRNIKILGDDSPVIMDFGIARDLSAESITATGDDQPMTWDYASPEQYQRDKAAITYRTDFFALAIIAYRLLYQRHPFGNTRDEVDQKFSQKDNAIILEEGNPLNNFFEANLALDPSLRPRNVEAFISSI